MERTEDLHIAQMKPLLSPMELKAEYPLDDALAHVVSKGRKSIQRIIRGSEDRILVILGPCSFHDQEAGFEYAERLKALQDQAGDAVLLVMRAYFEKPRTTLGWKGMLYDPYMDESDDIQTGFRMARESLIKITRIGLPCATEILDPIVPQFLADVVSWGSIGARTAASQIHRQMASGLSMPIGFKNSVAGDMHIAIDAIGASAAPHAFLGIDHEGRTCICHTHGNPYGHPVLRGGTSGPNYQSEYVAFTEILLQKAGIQNGILIDCSHANSDKDYHNQARVFRDVLGQIKSGSRIIRGVMLESFLHEGRQPLPPPGGLDELQYGVSVTDSCIGWEETSELILEMAEALD